MPILKSAKRKRLTAKAARLADKLGELKARIADLVVEEGKLREELLDTGVDLVEGTKFRVSVSHFTVPRIDYGAVLNYIEMEPWLRRVIKDNTKHCPQTCVRVSARNGEE